jgi:hypothetical protein
MSQNQPLGRDEPAKPRRKRGCLIFAILAAIGLGLVITLVAVATSNTTTGREGGSKAAKPRTPILALADSGNGAGRTAKFTVTGEFEIQWVWKSETLEGQEVGLFSAMLGGDTAGDLIANQTQSGEGVFHGDTGAQGKATYFITINAANGKWVLRVFDV